MQLKRVEVGGQADPESLTCYNLHVIVMSAFSHRTCAQETASFSGATGNAYFFFFVLKPIRLEQTLPGTYPQDYSGTESRAPCSRGGRSSPGTSRSGRRQCYPGSWCSGRHGWWNGTVQGQSSTPVIGHCSHRLSAKHTGEVRSMFLTKSILQDYANHSLPHRWDRWCWNKNDHQVHCSLRKTVCQ